MKTTLETVDASTDEGCLGLAEYEGEMEENVSRGQKLYAKVKKSSKYFYQNDWAKNDPDRWGWPFAVYVEPGDRSGYVVQGGPGGRYRLSDVNLFVVEHGQELKIS
jgi:hypothetical protein